MFRLVDDAAIETPITQHLVVDLPAWMTVSRADRLYLDSKMTNGHLGALRSGYMWSATLKRGLNWVLGAELSPALQFIR